MNPKRDIITLCDAVERSPCSDHFKAWYRELRSRVAGPSLGSIFGL